MMVLKERCKGADIEERIIKDCNGFLIEQIRFLPVEWYEPNDGWRSCRYINYEILKEWN